VRHLFIGALLSAQLVFNAGLQMRQTKMEIDLIGFGATLPNIGLYVNASFRINKYGVSIQWLISSTVRGCWLLKASSPPCRAVPQRVLCCAAAQDLHEPDRWGPEPDDVPRQEDHRSHHHPQERHPIGVCGYVLQCRC
jgi:hypothetical protein